MPVWLRVLSFVSFPTAVWSIIPCSGVHVHVHVLSVGSNWSSTMRFHWKCQRIRRERGAPCRRVIGSRLVGLIMQLDTAVLHRAKG